MSAETELNALKKLEANKLCANCDAFSKFGHGNVCEKFRTFVCSNCKSAHQSFSMRVKSVSMSNWSKEEVDALREENGGGNALAKRMWLATWDETQMRKPTDKDHVDYFKKFINRVYNDRAFYDDSPAAALPTRKDSGSGSSSSSSQRRASPAPATANVNLLDFAAPAFDAFGSSPAAAVEATSPTSDGWGAFASAPAPAPTSANDGFGDFAAFSAAPAAAVPAPAAAAPAQAFDPFGVSSQAPAPVQPVSFDPFGSSTLLQPSTSSAPSASPAPSASNGFGQFGAATPVATSCPAPGKNFSAFDALSGPNLAYGGGGGMYQQQQQHGMMNGGRYQQQQQPQYQNFHQQQQQQHMMTGGYGANAGANISAFMNPNTGYAATSGVGFVRQAPAGGSSSSRDPFAGLGLPQH